MKEESRRSNEDIDISLRDHLLRFLGSRRFWHGLSRERCSSGYEYTGRIDQWKPFLLIIAPSSITRHLHSIDAPSPFI